MFIILQIIPVNRNFFVGDNIWENLEEEKLTTAKRVFCSHSLIVLHCSTRVKPESVEPKLFMSSWWLNICSLIISIVFFHAKYSNGFTETMARYIDKPNSEIVSINYTSGYNRF